MDYSFEGEGPMTFDQTRALAGLTRGNEPGRGWERGENGGWYASVYDRRRLGVQAVQLYAEKNKLDMVAGAVVKAILKKYFTIDGDIAALAKNFAEWQARISAR